MENVVINVRRIKKIYDQMTDYPVKSLDNVSLQVKNGDFIAIMGPSGSGKTTLIQCLSTIDRPTQGDVFLYGKSIISKKYPVNTFYSWAFPRCLRRSAQCYKITLG